MISMVTNVWLAKPGQEDPTTSIIIVVLVLISGGIRFVQELRSDKAATNLSKMIVNTATVIREGQSLEVAIEDLVVGDIVKLSAGDMIPADLLLMESRDFFVQQSGLTGESDSVEKLALSKMSQSNFDSLLEAEALAFMATKGALEEMLAISTHVEYQDQISPLTDDIRVEILKEVDQLNQQGLRVLGVAYKTGLKEGFAYSVEDEKEMILTGYLAFLDPPKPSAASAIQALLEHGVQTKILTGDNEKVTQAVCEKVGLDVDQILLGSDIDNMTDEELAQAVEKVTVFAKLSPDQKARIILQIKSNGHCVGYMGDGINDAPSMKVADVGISVDTAVDIAKETADVVLLDKDLMMLEKGVVEGRKVYANMTKYIKMTVSSNFGNIFSLLVSGIFLPFLPMAPIHLIVLNLVYDLSCIALPFDNVDEDFLKHPHKWEAKSITRFMIWMGPISSAFDILTFILLYFVIVPMATGQAYVHGAESAAGFIILFQTGWFIESMWSQTMVIHMLRSAKLPFLQSRPSWFVLGTTLLAASFVTFLPYSSIASLLHLTPLEPIYFLFLLLIIVLYMISVTVVKRLYIKKFKSWL